MFVVTGASGFLGRHVVAGLAGMSDRVVAVARRPVPASARVRAIRVDDYGDLVPPGPDCVLVDLADTRDVAEAERAGDKHRAAVAARVGTLYSRNWGFVVAASSAAVYGDGMTHARREDEPTAPAGTYAAAKLEIEAAALARGGAALRISNLFGPGMASNNVVSDIIAQLPHDRPLRIRDGAPVRDFLWIADAAAAFVRTAVCRAAGIWNVGTGRGTSVARLAGMAVALAGTPSRPIVETAPAGRRSCVILDPSAIADRTSWRATVSLEDGLSSMLPVSG